MAVSVFMVRRIVGGWVSELDPLNWSYTYKWLAVALVSMSTTIV